MEIMKEKFDVIVVGSGAGGASVAKDLAAKGKKVLILEGSGGNRIKGSFLWALPYMMLPFKSLLLTPELLGMVRGLTTGGSSVFYYGTAFPVAHDAFKKYGIDLTESEKEARKELPIGPLKDEMVTPMARRMMESARALGYDWKKLDKFMYQDRWRPGYGFGYYGDRHEVKWSAKMYIDEAVRRGAVLLNRAKVKKVLFDGKTAKGVEMKYKGRTMQVLAKTVIVAAGGIGSPVVLRRSGIRNAGYNYFFDPLITVCGKVKDVRKRKDEIPMTAGCVMRNEGIVMTDMAVPFLLDQAFTASSFRIWRLFESRKTLRIMIKIRDDLAGSLTDRGGVRKRLTPADREKLRKGYDMAKNILLNAGAKGIYKTWKLAAHPGGTIRIGHMLDSNLKLKGYENLYVCDCSVIPEPFGLPPVLTLVCLGKRLAKHLQAEKQGSAKAKQPAYAVEN
ncbi:MAG TPA: GMC family oxidoreductase [Spirochaetota bacterium]|nr:GMC family oxidoreductase [Spirochaetota bacterium]HPV41149.1 GMC family oxidoreductase [Spirochaetota bacterium]